MLIVVLCVLYLLGHLSFILKLVLGCDCKLSLGRIQTGHADPPPPTGLWGIVVGVLVFVTEPVSIKTLIGFKEVPQVNQY